MKPEAKLSRVDPQAGIPSFYSSFSLSLPKTATPAHRDRGTTHPPHNHAQTKHHNSQITACTISQDQRLAKNPCRNKRPHACPKHNYSIRAKTSNHLPMCPLIIATPTPTTSQEPVHAGARMTLANSTCPGRPNESLYQAIRQQAPILRKLCIQELGEIKSLGREPHPH